MLGKSFSSTSPGSDNTEDPEVEKKGYSIENNYMISEVERWLHWCDLCAYQWYNCILASFPAPCSSINAQPLLRMSCGSIQTTFFSLPYLPFYADVCVNPKSSFLAAH